MSGKRIVAAADHAGYHLKAALIAHLTAAGHTVEDLGTHGPASVDYPDFAAAVAQKLQAREADAGLLICGTGQGMAMAANRCAGVRAAVVADTFSAAATRQHNDANVLCIGERVVGAGLAAAIADAFFIIEFEGGRHARRVEKLTALEGRKA